MQYNYRDKSGRFVKINYKNGSLYNWRGICVRLIEHYSDGSAYVEYHRNLSGTILTSELKLATKEQVNHYLGNT